MPAMTAATRPIGSATGVAESAAPPATMDSEEAQPGQGDALGVAVPVLVADGVWAGGVWDWEGLGLRDWDRVAGWLTLALALALPLALPLEVGESVWEGVGVLLGEGTCECV